MGPPTLPHDERNASLDLMRGLAALAVCAGHARAFVLVDWVDVRDHGVLDALIYFATGLGHQAVVVFFVLSGYFVGGGVEAAWRHGRWSWTSYAVNRLTRLLMVLLPALLLTLLLDTVGAGLAGGYDGTYHALLASGPAPNAPARHDAAAFFGNLAFLQTIVVPVYGSNGPLWSLANEFWYYVVFPLAWVAVAGRGAARLACAAVVLALLGVLPAHIVWPGCIWLMGYGASRLARSERLAATLASGWWLAASGIGMTLALVMSKRGAWTGWDYVIGLACAFLVAGIGAARGHSRFAPLGGFLADISYTLYLTHFPVLALLWFVLLAPAQYPPGPTGMACWRSPSRSRSVLLG